MSAPDHLEAQDESVAEQPQWTIGTHDLAGSHTDPLLASLVFLTKHFERTMSRDALVAGLPLEDGVLSPSLFTRAAARAGLTSKLVRRPLDRIPAIVLPVVLLLKNRGACVLQRVHADGHATILVPETDEGMSTVPLADLEAAYSGYAIFVKPQHRYSDRLGAEAPPQAGHWFWSTLAKLWPTYAEVVVAAGLVNCLALASPLFIMNVYDRVLPNAAFATLWVLAAGIALAFGFDFLLRVVRGLLIDSAGRRADVIMANQIFEHVLNIKMAARPQSTGAFANHLREFETVRDFFTSATLASMTDLLFVGLFIFVIYVVSGPLAYVPLAVVVITLVIGFIVQIPLARTVRQTQAESALKHGILVETVSSLDTIKSLGAEGRMQRAWERFVGATSRTSQKSRRISNLAMSMTSLLQQMTTVCIVVGGVYLVAEGEMTQGGIIAAVILGGRAVGPLAGVAGTLSRLNQSLSALRTLNSLMRAPVERPSDRNFVSRPITRGAVEFRDVTFAYPGSQHPALRNVTFAVEPGERVGVIGRIGSGKTTLGRLLVGFYEPDEGAVLVDGIDLRQYHPSDVRRGIGLVMQDVTLFQGTVRDNIAIGAPYADDAMILRAAQLAGVDAFIGSHPLGYDLPVGERGQMLSGGQRQSIALARAVLMDPPILMLDEPTSAMDLQAERNFIHRLDAVMAQGRTLIVTTHRTSLLRVVERLIVIDDGRILHDGPRDQVLATLRAGGQAAAAAAAAGAGDAQAIPQAAQAAKTAGTPTGAPQVQAQPPMRPRPQTVSRVAAVQMAQPVSMPKAAQDDETETP